MGDQAFDLVVKGALIVSAEDRHEAIGDIAVRDGRFVAVGGDIPVRGAEVIDGRGLVAMPGAVDAHQHWGIYNPLEEDVTSESRACAQGGVTTGITYIRTGRYYLERGGPYRDFMPEVLQRSAGRSYVDYAFHIAPMQQSHISELEQIVDEFGVTSFKIFMFYGGHGLHGKSDDQSDFLMTPAGESYDLAHFEFVMRGLADLCKRRPDIADAVSLSLHCETAEIMRAYTDLVQQEGRLSGLAAYSASRPPHSEGLAVSVAGYLAHVTGIPRINLLHLSSARAVEAALKARASYPEVDIKSEVTVGHLLADIETAAGIGGKVNPPLRSRADVEALWDAVHEGHIDWVVSDHACCRSESKFGEPADDVFLAKSGFGGTEYLIPGMVTEANRRGIPLSTIAALTAYNPARRYGLTRKGDIAVGLDADFTLIDPASDWVVRAQESESTQDYTPFEGFKMTAKVRRTVLRGTTIYDTSGPLGDPLGAYLARPQA